jgi:hypothetical protein
MIQPATLRVVATDEASQGQFVVINADDFDPAIHQLFEEQPTAPDEIPVNASTPKRRGRPPKEH